MKTVTGRVIAGEDEPNQTDAKNEINSCLDKLFAIRQHTQVKEILKDLDEQFKLPKNRRQRRSMDATGAHDVSEIYSPPRVTATAAAMGLRPGFALDLTVVDEDDGTPWDFSKPEKRQKATKMLDASKPFMLIVSPMCGPFSAIQNLNYIQMQKDDVKTKLTAAMTHIKFCIDLCLKQHLDGRLFLFEHPAGASSWDADVMKQMAAVMGVLR